MANITVAEVADAIPTIVAAEALGYLKANTVLARLVARDWDNEVQEAGKTITIVKPGSLVANDKAANTEVTLQAPNATKAQVTLDKHKEASFLIEDVAKFLSRPDMMERYIEGAMAAITEQVDADIAALYASAGNTIDASAGLTEAHLRKTRKLLNAAKLPLRDRFFVVHEDAEYELLGIDRFVNRDYAELRGAPPRLENAYLGRYAGFDYFMDQMITEVAGTPNLRENIAFQRYAIALASRPLPAAPQNYGVQQVVMGEDGLGLRVTMSYSHANLGYMVTIDLLYGVAAVRPEGIVAVTTAEQA